MNDKNKSVNLSILSQFAKENGISDTVEIAEPKSRVEKFIINELMPQTKEVINALTDILLKNNKLPDICPKVYEIPPMPELIDPDEFKPYVPDEAEMAAIAAANERRRLIEETQIDLLKKQMELLEKQLEKQAKDQTDTIIASVEQPSTANIEDNIQSNNKRVLTADTDIDDPNLLKSEKQIIAILKAIKMKQWQPFEIPDGDKSGSIEPICMKDYPKLFDGATSFDNAWKAGKKLGLFRMMNDTSYAKRGKQ